MKLVFVICLIIIQTALADKSELYVGALLELSNHWYENWVNYFINIIEHAFKEIENRTDILVDYSLKLIPKDTQGQSGLAARRLFEVMTEGPPVAAVIGPSLSSELTVVGQISPSYNVVHMSYLGSTSSTIDRDLFSTMFKVNQIYDDLNPLRIKMMQYFGWQRIGTLFYGDDINASHMNLFHDLIKKYNFTLVTSGVVSDENADLKPLIARFLQYEVRIIMASFRHTNFPKIICEAYKQGLYGRQYVWILPGQTFHSGWLREKLEQFHKIGCSFDEMLEATNWYIMLDYDKFDSRDIITVGESTPAEVKSYFNEDSAKTDYLLSASFAWVYDAAWALALGLNNSLRYLNESGLQNYTNNAYYRDAILKGMYDVSFAGVSGPVSFDAAGGRKGLTFIEQFYNDSRKRIAMYDSSTDTLEWFVPVESIWPDGAIPADRFTYQSVILEPNLPALILVAIANLICIVAALGFLTFNIRYRKNSYIKLSSPMINNIIIAGSIFMYVCVFFATFDYGHLLVKEFDDYLCMVRVWIMCLGFTALFGALFSKTWRVHILFRYYKLKKTSIKDWHLISIIGFLLMIDCILLIAWSCTHSLQRKKMEKKTMDRYDHNNVIAAVYTYCHHPNEGYWFVSMYIYKGLLLAFGTFLAYETRHVNIPALNDSKYIGFCIYNVVIVCIFGVPLMHVLPTEQTTLNFVLLSAFVMFCTTMCLCILFVPKIKMRNKVAEKFLIPTLNEKAATSTISQVCGSYIHKQKDTEKIIVTDVSTTDSTKKENELSNTKGKEESKTDSQTAEELTAEIIKVSKRVAADTCLIERMKRDLLEVKKRCKSSCNGWVDGCNESLAKTNQHSKADSSA